jgi:hypothetical protein
MRETRLPPLLSKLATVIIESKRELNLVLSQMVIPMTNQNCLTSACRHCRFYRPEGMHGGACQQLNVSVHSDWKACQLALPAFATTWDNVEELAHRQAQVVKTISSKQFQMVELELVDRSINVNN